MTTQEAKQLLSLYRPGTADAEDSEMAEALDLMRQDAELGRWFAERCKAQMILQRRFQEIRVPAGLKEQIISEHRATLARNRTRRLTALASVAVCAVVLLASWWFLKPDPDDKSATAFARRMVKSVRMGNYAMDMETNDVPAIRAFLASNKSPANYDLPKALETTTSVGCGLRQWQNYKVSMICFRTGRPLPTGEKTDLFLFVVDRHALPEVSNSKPVFDQRSRMATAVWLTGDKIYLLASPVGESGLKQYL